MLIAEAVAWLRFNGHHVKRLAGLGDKLAQRCEDAYRKLHANQLDPALQNEFIVIMNELVRRDLTTTERAILEERFGHKLKEEEHGPRVFTLQ
jgi:hypothetical protein